MNCYNLLGDNMWYLEKKTSVVYQIRQAKDLHALVYKTRNKTRPSIFITNTIFAIFVLL